MSNTQNINSVLNEWKNQYITKGLLTLKEKSKFIRSKNVNENKS